MKKIKKEEVVKKSKISQWAIVLIIAIAVILILVLSALNGNEKASFAPPCNVTNGGIEICDRLDNNCNNLTDEGLPITCSNDLQCGNSTIGQRYCLGGHAYANVTNFTCTSPGTCLSKCPVNKTLTMMEFCVNGCLNGNCIYNDSCTDTDKGVNKSLYGHAYGYLNNGFYTSSDVCVSSTKLLEYYCNLTKSAHTTINCLSTEVCLNGACVIKKADSCTDTDGGNYPTKKGTASGFLNNIAYFKTDVCSSSTKLTEYYCLNFKAMSTNVTCSNGCNNGACQQNLTNTCADTDGGLIWNMTGTVSGKKDNFAYTNRDFCINNKTLLEYYCSGGTYAMNKSYNCAGTNISKVCLSGACK